MGLSGGRAAGVMAGMDSSLSRIGGSLAPSKGEWVP